MPLRVALLVLASAAAVAGAAGPAAASCAESPAQPDLRDYDSVFAGSVVGLSHGGAAAEVSVLDVWHGPDLPAEVVVVGGQLERGVESSVDRSFRRGEEYVFFTYRGDGGSLRDNICTPTAPLPAHSQLDPAGVRAPVATAPVPTDPRGPARWPYAVAAVTAAGAVAALVRRRRAMPRG